MSPNKTPRACMWWESMHVNKLSHRPESWPVETFSVLAAPWIINKISDQTLTDHLQCPAHIAHVQQLHYCFFKILIIFLSQCRVSSTMIVIKTPTCIVFFNINLILSLHMQLLQLASKLYTERPIISSKLLYMVEEYSQELWFLLVESMQQFLSWFQLLDQFPYSHAAKIPTVFG